MWQDVGAAKTWTIYVCVCVCVCCVCCGGRGEGEGEGRIWNKYPVIMCMISQNLGNKQTPVKRENSQGKSKGLKTIISDILAKQK